MAMAAQSRDEEVGAALFELLLTTPLFALEQGDGMAFTSLPDGQAALPLFADRAALERFSPGARAKACTATQAAQHAMSTNDAWLVIEPGSAPGGQTIGRASAELLSRGTHPFAEAVRARHALVNDVCDPAQRDAALKERALSTRIVTLGSAPGATREAAPAPVLELGSVRGPDGSSAFPLWPTMTGCFVFMPGPVRRVTMPLGRLVEAALRAECGITVFRGPGDGVTVSATALADWWR